MQRYKFQITGITSLLMHNNNIEERDRIEKVRNSGDRIRRLALVRGNHSFIHSQQGYGLLARHERWLADRSSRRPC